MKDQCKAASTWGGTIVRHVVPGGFFIVLRCTNANRLIRLLIRLMPLSTPSMTFAKMLSLAESQTICRHKCVVSTRAVPSSPFRITRSNAHHSELNDHMAGRWSFGALFIIIYKSHFQCTNESWVFSKSTPLVASNIECCTNINKFCASQLKQSIRFQYSETNQSTRQLSLRHCFARQMSAKRETSRTFVGSEISSACENQLDLFSFWLRALSPLKWANKNSVTCIHTDWTTNQSHHDMRWCLLKSCAVPIATNNALYGEKRLFSLSAE